MKCVVIGIGHVALRRYLPALSAEPDIELACCSRSIESARRGATEFGGVALADLDQVADWAPDIAFVVTPDTSHVAVVERLIEQGVPRIYVEKPLAAAAGQTRIGAADLADGARLHRAAAEHGVQLAMGYNYRHFATVAAARAEVAGRGWSQPSGVVAWTHYACLSHVIDLVGVFLGELDTIAALRGPDAHGDEKFRVEDRVVAFTAVSGATGVLRASAAQPRADRLFDLTVSYPEGTVRIADLDGTLETFDAAAGRRIRSERGDERSREDGYEESFGTALRAYLDTVRSGALPPSSGADGVRELRFHAAVEQALASGRSVRLGDLR